MPGALSCQPIGGDNEAGTASREVHMENNNGETTSTRRHNFIHDWLPDAFDKAKDKIASSQDVERFLPDAWNAFKNGGASADFGRAWQRQE